MSDLLFANSSPVPIFLLVSSCLCGLSCFDALLVLLFVVIILPILVGIVFIVVVDRGSGISDDKCISHLLPPLSHASHAFVVRRAD